MPLDPALFQDVGTAAGTSAPIAILIGWLNKFFLDKKIEKMVDSIIALDTRLSKNYLEKEETKEIIREMKREFELLAAKFDQANATLIKIEYAISNKSGDRE